MRILRCRLEQAGSEERGVFGIPKDVLQIKDTKGRYHDDCLCYHDDRPHLDEVNVHVG